MGKDMCMAQLYLYSSPKLASIFIALSNMEMMGTLVAEHRSYTWRHRLHFRLERLSTDNERCANKLEILHETNTIFMIYLQELCKLLDYLLLHEFFVFYFLSVSLLLLVDKFLFYRHLHYYVYPEER